MCSLGHFQFFNLELLRMVRYLDDTDKMTATTAITWHQTITRRSALLTEPQEAIVWRFRHATAFRLAEVFMAGTGSGLSQSYRLHCGQTLGSFRFRFSHE